MEVRYVFHRIFSGFLKSNSINPVAQVGYTGFERSFQ